MKILSIETSSEICAVALTEDKKVIKEEILENKNTHSVNLMPLVDKLLKETNTSLNEIDLFGCDIGPGSFTGIRIGVATIKAFLDSLNKKAVGVNSLDILAYNIKENGIICSIIDAKNNNVYYGIYEYKNETYIKIEMDFDNIENIINKIEQKYINKKIFFIGNGSKIYEDMIKSKMKKEDIIVDEKYNKLNARNIGFIAFENREKCVESNELIPVYLRKSSAEK